MNKILVLGSSNTDMTVRTQRIPIPGETVLGGEFKMSAGGKGANQAISAKKLGGDVSYVCKVGNDMFGDGSVSHYKSEGLDVEGILRSDKPSGVALITVDDEAENCIVVASGANLDFTDEDLEKCRPALESCDILLMQLEIPVDIVCKAAKIACAAGALVVLNPAPYTELPESIFKDIGLFIPNRNELANFAGIEVTDEASARSAVKVMMEKGVGKVIVTLGGRGSLVFDGDEVSPVKAFKVNAVDTTGAGDCYCGGLCVALAEGKSLKEASEFASAASALSVTKLGAQTAIPTREEVEAFVASVKQ